MNNNCNQFWNEYEHEVREWLPNEASKSLRFFRDGIVCQDKYWENGFRPLFIFKEVNDHDKNGCNGCEKHKICQSESICVCNEESKYIDFTRCNDIQKCKGMWKKTSDLEHTLEEIYGVQPAEGLKKAAIINLKKISGGGNANSESSMKTLHYACHATKFQEKLRTQIECIKPTIIICCGTFEIGEYIRTERQYNFLGYCFAKSEVYSSQVGEFSIRGRSLTLSIGSFKGSGITENQDVQLLDINHPTLFNSDKDWIEYLRFFKSAVEKMRNNL